jgi:hypothetical protein
MAIDFGRMFRNVATGYLSAKIANTEANDKLNANIIERAGLNFYENTLPEWQKTEKIRETEFKQISSAYGEDFANAAAEEGWITGDGNAFNNISSILKTKNIDKNYFKGKKFSTFAERKALRTEEIQNKEKTIMGLTSGSSKIGNMTAELLLQDNQTMTDAGTGTIDTATETQPSNVEGAPVVPIQERSTMEADVTTGSLFTSKAPDVEGAQARYKHIANTVNELEGYTTNVIYGEGGQINLNMFGERRNEAAAHIALANRLITQNPQQYNQNNAATTAKQQLNYLTVSLFENIAAELKVEYKSGSGKLPAIFGTPGTTYDANKVLSNGQTIDQIILGTINEIPTGPSGEINEAVLARLIENIPDGLIINGANYKQQLKTELAIRSSNFWAKRNI